MDRRKFLKILSESAASLAFAPTLAHALCPPQNLKVDTTGSADPNAGCGVVAGLAGRGVDAYYTGDWRTTADTVNGWDWSYSNTEKPAELSGVFQFSAYSYPANFPGKRLKKIDADWKELEKSEGVFDFSEITDALNNSAYDYCQLDIRGTTKVNPLGRTTADQAWLAEKGYPTFKESNGMVLYDLSDPGFISQYNKLISAIAKTTVPGTTFTVPHHPKLISQIVHGVSTSQLEEWTGGLASQIENDPNKSARLLGHLKHWINSYGSAAKKLGWVGTSRPWEAIIKPAIAAGMGTRGGVLEAWLGWEKTPRYADAFSGQSVEVYKNINGVTVTGDPYPVYLTVDQSDPRINTIRHYGDQNEEYVFLKMDLDGSGVAPPLRYQQNYRMSMLRGLQMQVNVCAVERPKSELNNYGGSNGFVNPALLKWTSLQLGHKANTAKEAFCCLCKTYTRSYNPLRGGTDNLEINNIERWLYQREPYGATTTTLKRGHGVDPDDSDYKASGVDTFGNPMYRWTAAGGGGGKLPQDLWHIYLARLGATIGFRLDDEFLTGASSVAVKVTYWDTGNETWRLEYKRSNGTTASLQNTNTNSKTVKTAINCPSFLLLWPYKIIDSFGHADCL